jgi:hypothetical protein
MPGPFSFKKLTDPIFEAEFPNGDVKKYDPWAISEKLESLSGKPSVEVYDEIRKAFGFPTQSEVDATPEGTDKPYTLTRHQALEIQAAVFEFIKGLDVSKKMKAMSAS